MMRDGVHWAKWPVLAHCAAPITTLVITQSSLSAGLPTVRTPVLRSSSPLDLHRRHAHCGDDRADQEDRMCRLPAAATRITARRNTRTDRIPWTDQLLRRYTDGPIGLAVGLPAIRLLIDEAFYRNLAGGSLESTGRLFKRSVRMYIYPERDPVTGQVQTWDSVQLPPPWQHLHRLLGELGHIVPLRSFDESYMTI